MKKLPINLETILVAMIQSSTDVWTTRILAGTVSALVAVVALLYVLDWKRKTAHAKTRAGAKAKVEAAKVAPKRLPRPKGKPKANRKTGSSGQPTGKVRRTRKGAPT